VNFIKNSPFVPPDYTITPFQTFHEFSVEMEARKHLQLPNSIFEVGRQLGRLVHIMRTKRAWSREKLSTLARLSSGEILSPIFVALLEEGYALPSEITPQLLETLAKAFGVPRESLELLISDVPVEKRKTSSLWSRVSRRFHKPTGYIIPLWSFTPVAQPALLGERISDAQVNALEKHLPDVGLNVLIKISNKDGVQIEIEGDKRPVSGWTARLISGTQEIEGSVEEEGLVKFSGIKAIDPNKIYIHATKDV
jgi:hypothetical protein